METYIMKKRIIWQDAILKKIKIVFFFFIFFTISNFSFASERWVVDKTLSIIEFELPVLFAKNVKGTFNSIDGYVEIDTNTKKNNKAIFSVLIEDIEINYSKYKGLILSDIFKEIVESQRLTYTIINELNSIQLAFAELIRFMVDQKDQDRIAANAALAQTGKDPKDAAGEQGMDVKAEGGFALPAATLFGAVSAYVYGLSEYIRVFTLPKTIGILGAIPKAIGTFAIGIGDFFKKLGKYLNFYF